MTFRGVNYYLKESNSPTLTALNIGCKVILLKNILAQYKFVNGSIRTVKEIILKHTDGPRYILYGLSVCVLIELK